MGTYTEFFFRAEIDAYAFQVLLKLTPYVRHPDLMKNHNVVIEVGAEDDKLVEFLKCERWTHLFLGDSAYSPGPSRFDIGEEKWGVTEVPESVEHWIFIYSSFKNYGNEIERFFDWLLTHAFPYERQQKKFLGYALGENADSPIYYYRGPLED